MLNEKSAQALRLKDLIEQALSDSTRLFREWAEKPFEERARILRWFGVSAPKDYREAVICITTLLDLTPTNANASQATIRARRKKQLNLLVVFCISYPDLIKALLAEENQFMRARIWELLEGLFILAKLNSVLLSQEVSSGILAIFSEDPEANARFEEGFSKNIDWNRVVLTEHGTLYYTKDLDLSPRAAHYVSRAYPLVDDLLHPPITELAVKCIRNIGVDSIAEVIEQLQFYGLRQG